MNNKSTEQLLSILNTIEKKDKLTQFVAENDLSKDLCFYRYINEIMEAKGLTKSEIVRASLISRTYAYQILDGRKSPNRDKVLSFCLAAKMNLDQIQKALLLAGHGELYSKFRRDAVIIFAINNNLDVLSTNELLYDMQENILD